MGYGSRKQQRADGSAFTANQRVTYGAVLDAQIAVIGALKPGVQWQDMHRLAERTILRTLLGAGVLTAGGLEEEAALDAMLDADLGAVFMPHGHAPQPTLLAEGRGCY